jgi:hypothetical protein
MADNLLSFIKEESESEEELLMEVHLPQHSASASEELFHFRYVYYNVRNSVIFFKFLFCSLLFNYLLHCYSL